MGLTADGWDTLARGANRIAREVRAATGLRTVFHHHCATFVETPEEIDELMTRTDPSLVGLCLDTGHCAFGGGNPVATLDRWRSRVWHVHLKDCEPAIKARASREAWDYPRSIREGVFCELGKGEVDFAAVLSVLHRTGYQGWLVVEQDVIPSLGTPIESAARNRSYLRTRGCSGFWYSVEDRGPRTEPTSNCEPEPDPEPRTSNSEPNLACSPRPFWPLHRCCAELSLARSAESRSALRLRSSRSPGCAR